MLIASAQLLLDPSKSSYVDCQERSVRSGPVGEVGFERMRAAYSARMRRGSFSTAASMASQALRAFWLWPTGHLAGCNALTNKTGGRSRELIFVGLQASINSRPEVLPAVVGQVPVAHDAVTVTMPTAAADCRGGRDPAPRTWNNPRC